MKNILGVYDPPNRHWVGDGFPVRTLFTYNDHGRQLSPFLLLDYAAPTEFAPAKTPRGVGQHPHRGFETVTLAYQGEVAHRDSTGRGGVIGPGDVQWMTAGAGILHEEFHSPAFSQTGGTFEMVQLWVNLPAADKMSTPRYQAITRDAIPVVELPDSTGSLRVIAGEYQGHQGPAHTFSPINLWDMQLLPGRANRFSLPAGWSAALLVLEGEVSVNGDTPARHAQLVVLDRTADDFTLEAQTDAKVLLLSGEPLQDPVVGYGPFVMNSKTQIRQAISDFNSGGFGQMPD